jgi:hypothetical protein
MGGLVRWIVLLLIAYLILRRLSRWLLGDQPQVKGKRRTEPPPFEDRDVTDAKFTEIPDEKKPTSQNGEK